MEIKVYMFADGVPQYHGTIDLDTETFTEREAEECFHLCNWSCWTEEKPENNHTDIDVCNHGLALQTPTETWLALSVGWKRGTSTEISEYAMKNKNSFWWD